MFRQYRLRDYNFRLVLWVLAISALGVLLVGSANSALESRQLFGVISGCILMFVISVIDFSWIMNFYWIAYVLNILMLLAVRILGRSVNGASRWIQIGGFSFQPVELSKILLILFFSRYFMDHENDLNRPRVFFRTILLIGAPLALIFAQPDLKNTITVLVVFAVLYYAAGLSYKIIFGVIAAIVPLVAAFMVIVLQPDQKLINEYQRDRIMTFLYPESDQYSGSALQQKNSMIAIGSGQLTGKGLNNSEVDSVNKGNFIAEIQTDFIFAVAGEELGFFGSAGIVILLLLVVLECLMIGRKAKDLAGRLICTGMAGLVSVQSFINIGVTCGLLPNTGTPLPFISYGLTSLVSLFMGMGFVLNVGMQERIRIGGNIRL